MELIKTTPSKGRTVYFDGTHYVKEWNNINVDSTWIVNHVRLLDKVVPYLVVGYGNNWISYNVIPGIPANTFEHTLDFVDRIYKFCLENIKQTHPYYHGDWVLSNILIDGDTIAMCDWDNLGIYNHNEILDKLDSDLSSAFGEIYTEYKHTL